MMKLSNMLALIQSIRADGYCPAAETALSFWQPQPGSPRQDVRSSARLLRASSNFIFSFQAADQPFILRLTPAEQRTSAALKGELDFITQVIRQGVRANRPIPSLKGQLVESFSTDLGSFHAVAFEFVAGEQVELEQLPPEKYTAWGQALGELHNAAQLCPLAARPTWRDLVDQAKTWLDPEDQRAKLALERVLDELNGLPVSAESFGLIHFDFELDNLVWQPSSPLPTAIDFDDCLYVWFAADIAFALRDLFDDRPSRVDLNHPELTAFLAGYRSVRSLPDHDLVHLPLFLRLLNLHKYAQLGQIVSEGALPGEPEWVRRLRSHLEKIRAKYREEISFYTHP